MNLYNFSALSFSFCTFLIGVFVLLKRRDRIAVSFLVFSLFVTLWGVGFSALTNEVASYHTVLFWNRLSNVSAIFISVTWVHFVLTFLGCDEQKKKQIVFLYIFGLAIATFGFSRWFIPALSENLIQGFRWYPKLGPIYHLFAFLFFSAVPYGFIKLLIATKEVKGEKLAQLKTFIVATLFGFVGGSLTFAPAYKILVPQYGVFLMPLYPFMMAYAMIRHRLFDVEQIAQAFQREKLATIGLITASINHEIRNPLYAAKGILDNYVEMAKEGLENKDPVEIAERTRTQINRALDVITKLNRFAKPSEETKDSRQKAQANIQEALKNVLDLVSYEFELDKIKINNQISKDLPPIQADQRQLEEILFNLIVNACHAMFPGGTLELRSTVHDSRIALEIIDTGSGISQDHLKHLFEPFHTTKGEKGTGLGLYITKQLVERNGGKIEVSSIKGQGATFIFSLPKSQVDS